jgi:EAL domain-containing protein (putative c-di-GMP-specific phosphodiesterase class I)
MKTPIIVDGHPFDITFSIGVKIFPNHENGYEEVISHADIAMYKAKKSGKNQFAFFDTELDIELKQFSLLEKEIKKALINKEFVLHYQPKIDIMTNKMIGMEALARWSHPKKGLLSPNEFLQVVADTRNMYILETLLIEQIFAQISKWKQQYQKFDYIIAINITPESFQNDKFIPFLQNCISKYNIDASILELELVENTFVTDMQQAISKIQILKSIGIKFAIDDFGTGYSSLTYLQKLPIDSIKIDKSFIMDIDDQSNKEIVKMIINFAKLFNLKVVAEGVENIKTLNFLVDLKCDYYQGYFYSRAISAKEIEKFL